MGKNCYTGAALEWMPMYVSQAEVDGETQAILTLWLNNSATSGEYEVSYWSDSASYQKTIQSNLYSASTLHALVNNGYTYNGGKYYGNGRGSAAYITYEHRDNNKFAEFSGDGVFSEYIVAPENVAWQMAESDYKNDPANTTYAAKDYGNDYTYNGWTKDNLWIPSLEEMYSKSGGIWGANTAQRAGTTYNATRNGYGSSYDVWYMYNSGSGCTYPNTCVMYSVRPALHLNLSLLGKTVKAPCDINKEYTGSAYSRNDIAGKWYKPDLMDVDWPVDMLNAGERKIKVTLNALAKQKELVFRGTPDTSKGKNDYTRYFTFTITRKNVSIGWDEQNYESESSYFLLPTLNVTPEVQALLKDNGAVKYYLAENYDAADKKATGPAVALADIQEGKNYYAAVEIVGDKVKDNYEFGGSVYCAFNTTDNRTLVYISPTKSEETYNGKQLPTDVKITDKNGEELTDISYTLTYKDGDGAVLTAPPKNAGAYTVVVSLSGVGSETYKIGEKEFTYVINKADPVLEWVRTDGDVLYEGCDLPEIVPDDEKKGTPGTYTPDLGQTLTIGEGTYTYTFVPDDAENYKTGAVQVTLNAVPGTVVSIETTFSPTKNGEAVTVYTSWSENDIKQYLTVYAIYDNGGRSEVKVKTRYSVTDGHPLSAGDNTITVTYYLSDEEFTCDVDVNDVVLNELLEISSVVKSGKVYTSFDEETLANMLTVKGKYKDGRTGVLSGAGLTVTVDPGYVDENGKLKAGTGIVFTVNYADGENVLTYDRFTIDVEEIKLTDLSVEFDAGPYEITSATDKATLLKCLTVTGKYNDGAIKELEIEEQDITAKLVDGATLRITVTRDGVSGYYDVKVPEEGSVKTFTLSIPALERTYTGEEIDVLSDWQFASLVESGDVVVVGNKKTNAGTWELTVTIKNTAKYKWPQLAEYALADEETGYVIDGATLTATWVIAKAVVKGAWNDQGTLDVVCAGYTGDVNALIKYVYYKDGKEVDTSAEPLVIGAKYTVTAYLADTSNFTFDGATAELLGEPHEFTMTALPTSGFNAVWNKITGAMVQKTAGLPLWAWLLIALAVLLLLIIIIVAAKKRKKTKEEREEKKAKKEEEKQRREEERRMQQERMQAERELAKAKQEAELEKIRAQAGLAAGAGMASMAVQQQPQPVRQQAPMQAQPQVQQQQQTQQYMPMPQTADTSALEERLRAVEERARCAEERIVRAAEERARQAEERTLRAAEERARLAEEQLMRNAYMNQANPNVGGANGNVSLDALGALMLAAFKNMAGKEQTGQIAPAEQPQMIEAGSSQSSNVQTVYPSDAVITTTTTVDTTKKPPQRGGRDGANDFADLDGFYDAYDE